MRRQDYWRVSLFTSKLQLKIISQYLISTFWESGTKEGGRSYFNKEGI